MDKTAFCSKSKKGFTLFEVVVVIVLIAVLSAMAASSVSLSEAELIKETDALKSHIRYAQYEALAGNNDVAWGVDFATGGTPHSYSMIRVESGSTTNMMMPGGGGASHTLSDQVTIQSVSPTLSGGRLTFDEWGNPNTASDVTITLAQNGVTRTITINQTTGFVQ